VNRWSSSFLRVVFAFAIAFLAAAISLAVRAALHTQNDRITGMAFLVAVVCLVLFFEKVFPAVYPSSLRRRTPRWWQLRAVWVVVFGIAISILSSRVASLWFGLTAVGSVLVALLLRATRDNSDELELGRESKHGMNRRV
jgi:peptidoglycan/LPS O-acetylase OafA/YrhL